jgi:hypothetical protein
VLPQLATISPKVSVRSASSALAAITPSPLKSMPAKMGAVGGVSASIWPASALPWLLSLARRGEQALAEFVAVVDRRQRQAPPAISVSGFWRPPPIRWQRSAPGADMAVVVAVEQRQRRLSNSSPWTGQDSATHSFWSSWPRRAGLRHGRADLVKTAGTEKAPAVRGVVA